jgi:hypothetical protein
MIPATDDLVCEWLKVKWCRIQVQNPISVFQIKKKSEEFLIQRLFRGNPAYGNLWEQGSVQALIVCMQVFKIHVKYLKNC